MERIDLSETDIHNFIKDKDWGENTTRQNEWRINQIINTNDFSNLEKYSWFPGLYKHLKNVADKKKLNLNHDVKIINLQKELEIYKKNMSLEQIKATTELLSTINNINNINKEPALAPQQEVEVEDKNYNRVKNRYLREKRLKEEAELEHKAEKDKLLVQVDKFQKLAIKHQKLYEDLLDNKKKNYSSDEDENCGYN